MKRYAVSFIVGDPEDEDLAYVLQELSPDLPPGWLSQDFTVTELPDQEEPMNSIRTDDNLVEVVHVHEKPDRDPAEPHIADVEVYQRGDAVVVYVLKPDGEIRGEMRIYPNMVPAE